MYILLITAIVGDLMRKNVYTIEDLGSIQDTARPNAATS